MRSRYFRIVQCGDSSISSTAVFYTNLCRKCPDVHECAVLAFETVIQSKLFFV